MGVRLNGWQRAFVVLAVTWSAICLVAFWGLSPDTPIHPWRWAVWLVPLAIIFSLGWAIGWVARGFRRVSR